MTRLSLVIPCFNEERNLPALRESCAPILKVPGTEIIVVNNGSNDNSTEVLRSMRSETFRVIDLDENAGYGGGIFAGLRIARGAVVGWTHADLQTDPADSIEGLRLAESLGKKFIVKGSRSGRPLSDRFFSAGMGFFESLLFGVTLTEINAQPTLFARSLLDEMTKPPSDFSLDLYAYVTALRCDYQIARFPVEFFVRRHGQSKWNYNFRSRIKFIRRTVSYSLELRKSMT